MTLDPEATRVHESLPRNAVGEATSFVLAPGPSAGNQGSGSQGSGPPAPAPRVGVEQQGKQRRFSEETTELLRSRLRAAAIDLTVVLGLGFIGNSLAGNSQWLLLRSVVLASTIGTWLLLRSQRPVGRSTLRSLELLLFGGVAVQVGLMMYSLTARYAALSDATSMVGAQQFFFAAFCLHILTYAIFMPNTWQRAAVVTTSLAILPYLICYLQLWMDPKVAEMARLNKAPAPIPVTLVAALIGTFGSHIINRTRREAFQAKQFLQYRLQEKIGSGGMGDVFRAEHVLLKRQCAIKLIRAEQGRDVRTLKLFEREVVATARLTHWNTIDIYDYGNTEDGTFFYVMELLEGASLQALIARIGPLPPARVVYLLGQACDALQEAHEAGLIHRDIKPANIFVTRRGGNWDVVKLLDFGLVKVTEEVDPASSSTGGFSGTPAYMAPEQAMQYDQVDPRSDLYALGAVACFLLTGEPPFTSGNLAGLLAAHAFKPVPSLRERNPAIPVELEAIVHRCLEKKPPQRFQSAAELAAALRACPVGPAWDPALARDWWSTHSPDPAETSPAGEATAPVLNSAAPRTEVVS